MIIPHSPEIERAVIGQILLEPDLIRKGGLREADFHEGNFRRIYRAMEGLFRKGQGVDLPLLSDHLSEDDLQTLNEISSEVFTSENFSFHVSRLQELSAKRKIQSICAEVAGKVSERSLNEVILRMRADLSEVVTGQGAESLSGGEMAKEGWRTIKDRGDRRGRLSGIPCGLRTLDDHLDGLQDSELTLIAARPGIGKSAFALHCLLTAAQAGFCGAFLSLEMGRKQIQYRLHSTLSGIPLWHILKGSVESEGWKKITHASDTLNHLPVHFLFGVRNLKDIIGTMIRHVENQGVKIFFLDYLQLVRAEGAQNREREISMISGELKSLAVSLKIPIVALSQLNRKSEERGDKRPGLSDLRDSGSLEQDADNVILLWREDITKTKGPIDFIVGKGRQTGGTTVHGYFDGETQTFSQ